MHDRKGLIREKLSTVFLISIFPLSFSFAIETEKLNVIVFDVCSARADHFSMNGYKRPTTPGLDSFAKEAVSFDNAMAQGSWCLPNYASLLTGYVPEVHGRYTNDPLREIPKTEKTLAEKLGQAGYRTGAFSGGIYLMPIWNLNRGFDTYVNLFSTNPAIPTSFAQIAPKAEKWIADAGSAPFFLYLAVDDLHAPYQADDLEKFDPGYEGIVHDTDVTHVRFFRAYNNEEIKFDPSLNKKLQLFRNDPRGLSHLTAHYDASLNQVDQEITEFIKKIKEMGLWEHTVVIVTADHGELLGEHGLLGHTQGLYQPVLHVPLLMHVPGFKGLSGKRFPQLTQRIDITPTILDMAGVSYKDDELQGQSLLPLLKSPTLPFRTYAWASSKRNMAKQTDLTLDERVVRDDRWKLIWYKYKNHFELYDLKNDPAEDHDESVKHPDIVQRLAFQLIDLIETNRPHAPGLPSGAQHLPAEAGDLRSQESSF